MESVKHSRARRVKSASSLVTSGLAGFFYVCTWVKTIGIMGTEVNLKKRMKNVRFTSRLLVLGTVLILLSGSLVNTKEGVATEPEWAAVMESLLLQQEQDLEAYSSHLRQVGEELFAEREGELRRAQSQRFHNAAKALQAQVEAELKELQEDLNGEILRHQLQLMLVSLDEQEQEAKLNQITRLQEEIKEVKTSLEAEYQRRFQELQAEHEERNTEELLALQNKVERAMDEEFAEYRLGLLKDLEEIRVVGMQNGHTNASKVVTA